MTENQMRDNDSESKAVHDNPYALEEVLAEIERQQSGGKSWLKNLFILLISLFIFFKFGLLKSGVSDLLIIILVLLVHEMGHFIGMRLFGYRNVQMFFIPFLGAAVSGESQNVATYKKAIVTLLGPVPGLLLGIIFGVVYVKTRTPLYLQLMIMFFIINSFNLLPFFPLDGGRFLYEVLFSRNRYIELCFKLLASLALIAVGLLLGAWLLALLGLFSLISVGPPFKIAGIAKDLKPGFLMPETANTQTILYETTETERITPEIAKEIIEKVRQRISTRLNLKTVAAYTKEVWERMHLRPPRVFATIGLLGAYLLCFCIPFMVLIAAAVISLAEENPFTERKIVEYQKPNGEMGRKEQFYLFGKLTTEVDVAADRLVYHGRSVSYHEDGTIRQEGTWHNGKWDGEWKDYDQNGNLTCTTIFDKGKFVKRKELKDGHWIEKVLEDLPWVFRKVCLDHADDPPHGPKQRQKTTEVPPLKP